MSNKKELQFVRLELKIAELRKQQGLTQKELAEKLHTKQQYIARIEKEGYNKLTLTTLMRLADIFNKQLVVEFR